MDQHPNEISSGGYESSPSYPNPFPWPQRYIKTVEIQNFASLLVFGDLYNAPSPEVQQKSKLKKLQRSRQENRKKDAVSKRESIVAKTK